MRRLRALMSKGETGSDFIATVFIAGSNVDSVNFQALT